MDWEKAGILQNETVWANAGKMPPEAWYEIYVKPWHPELARLAARVGMRVLSQVILASSCERNWSAHGHTHTKIQSRLDPATAQRVDRPAGRQLLTEKLVYVYSNSKLVASTRDADKLKMFALDNEDVTAGLLRPDGPGQARGAESLISARGARRESRLRASARLG